MTVCRARHPYSPRYPKDLEMQLISDSAIVTGGGQGMGRGLVLGLLRYGANVVIADLDVDAAADTAALATAEQLPGRTSVVQADVTDPADIARVFDEAHAAFGAPGILVNNVGAARLQLIADTQVEDWDSIMATCTRSTLLGIREFARRHDQGRQGAIVNVSSVNAVEASDGMAGLCAAKAAVSQLTKAAALELAALGVTVNAVAPGLVRTAASEGPFLDGPLGAEFVARTPLGRIGEPADVAEAVAFLCSVHARWITGVHLPVDGGMHLRGVPSYWGTLLAAGQV
jgi:glucose 1-dehydrogenase